MFSIFSSKGTKTDDERWQELLVDNKDIITLLKNLQTVMENQEKALPNRQKTLEALEQVIENQKITINSIELLVNKINELEEKINGHMYINMFSKYLNPPIFTFDKKMEEIREENILKRKK